jgi:CHRD domain
MKRAILLALMAGLLVAVLGTTVSARPTTFRAVLSGSDEVPARDTLARGVAIVRLDAEGTALGFRLIVANIENVFAAHIHCGIAGVSGPVGVTLFTGAPGGGRTDGVLASGSVTAPDAGNLCAWADLDDVVAALESGVAYVNVHTSDGVAPADTGPGDFPGGEIRGQIF